MIDTLTILQPSDLQFGKNHRYPDGEGSFNNLYAKLAEDLDELAEKRGLRPTAIVVTLTVSHDGGVPVYFTSHSGNVVDDKTHCAMWDLLCQLVGGPDFLYVADCTLASRENLRYIVRTGRFVTVMPRTHGEDEKFHTQLWRSPQAIRWEPLYVYEVTDEQGQVTDRLLKLLGDVRTDMDMVQSADRRGPCQEDDPGDQLLGMLHLLPCAIFHGVVQPLVTPVGAHLCMDNESSSLTLRVTISGFAA